MKKYYQTPASEITLFEEADVIITSPGVDENDVEDD